MLVFYQALRESVTLLVSGNYRLRLFRTICGSYINLVFGKTRKLVLYTARTTFRFRTAEQPSKKEILLHHYFKLVTLINWKVCARFAVKIN